ncbi:thioredoxin family protein [Chelativorans sp. M5D2P16]|uniref:DUF899 domain-containing protein n=1 Tax=Chelativorans sp. M5D2P16 TaxID=3095678 RepID=UPI002ACA56F1|nr:thioredoxin family protein [Chelativorans sp. M5D2P16]MDZ5698097.1 thioredoxin family protein [Chelativorans sp. M5D2P16]
MHNQVVSRQEWLAARKALLEREKEAYRLRDEIAEARRALPWVRIDKNYVFDTPAGSKTLADLFEGRSQLIVQHFMFPPDWEAGCPGCSFEADHVDSARQHFLHKDVTFVAVSRAPIEKIEAYRERMGWTFPWVSSGRSDFNYDFQVSFRKEDIETGKAFYNFEPLKEDPGVEDLPGMSVFLKDAEGAVFHTYSTFARGGEEVLGALMYLDLTPVGRNEKSPLDWIHRHDEYPAEEPRAS